MAARSPDGSGAPRSASFDDPFVMGLIAMTCYGLIWASWRFGHAYIAKAYAYVRYAQFYLLHALGELVSLPGVRAVHDWIGGLCMPSGLDGCRRDFATVGWNEISDSSLTVNLFLMALLLAYCVRLFLRARSVHPKIKYARAHSIDSFVAEQKEVRDARTGRRLYPHLRLFSALDLIDTPLDHPVFGMAETSRQFAFGHALVAGWRAEAGGFWAPSLDREAAAAVFRAQLGQHWSSSAQLSPAETLLVAITAPRVAATDTALDDDAFRKAMADSEAMVAFCWEQFKPAKGQDHAWLTPKIDLARPRAVIKQYIGAKPVQAILARHAFNRTVIMALFTEARRLGVLPPAEMRWLRFYDRPLWYALQTIGRQAGFAEAAGVLSHYLYEARTGHGIAEAQLDKAVSGLEAALDNFKFTADDKARYAARPRRPAPGDADDAEDADHADHA